MANPRIVIGTTGSPRAPGDDKKRSHINTFLDGKSTTIENGNIRRN